MEDHNIVRLNSEVLQQGYILGVTLDMKLNWSCMRMQKSRGCGLGLATSYHPLVISQSYTDKNQLYGFGMVDWHELKHLQE